jgi:small subunit ribosomal protein S2
MERLEFKQLLDAGVHFGHLRRKWNPNMAPYIFDEKKGIHIIDLNKTAVKLEEAANAMKGIARSGKKILFVATKKQAKDIVTEKVKPTGMPYVTERWSGGMLTNFGTIRRTIKKMATIDRMRTDGTFENMSKRERLQVSRQREKMEKNLGSIADLTRLPSALFIVDIVKEHIAVAEARKLNIPTFAMVDTNSDPSLVDFPIPANDDATKSIELIVDVMIAAINEGIEERKNDKTAVDEASDEEGGEEGEVSEKPAVEAAEEVAADDTTTEEN